MWQTPARMVLAVPRNKDPTDHSTKTIPAAQISNSTVRSSRGARATLRAAGDRRVRARRRRLSLAATAGTTARHPAAHRATGTARRLLVDGTGRRPRAAGTAIGTDHSAT